MLTINIPPINICEAISRKLDITDSTSTIDPTSREEYENFMIQHISMIPSYEIWSEQTNPK